MTLGIVQLGKLLDWILKVDLDVHPTGMWV